MTESPVKKYKGATEEGVEINYHGELEDSAESKYRQESEESREGKVGYTLSSKEKSERSQEEAIHDKDTKEHEAIGNYNIVGSGEGTKEIEDSNGDFFHEKTHKFKEGSEYNFTPLASLKRKFSHMRPTLFQNSTEQSKNSNDSEESAEASQSKETNPTSNKEEINDSREKEPETTENDFQPKNNDASDDEKEENNSGSGNANMVHPFYEGSLYNALNVCM